MNDGPLRLLLVDDEPHALHLLELALEARRDVRIVGTAGTGNAALDEAQRLKPDIIILDIEMPDLNGLAVAAKLPSEKGAEIIILSAFEHYAAAAFQVEALDYLIKPLDAARLDQAMARAHRRRAESRAYAQATVDAREAEEAFIAIPDRHGGRHVPIAQITWIEAARDYALIHTRLRSHIMRITMSSLSSLVPSSIRRVHRSAYVNFAEVRGWGPTVKGVCSLVLSDGTNVSVGPTYVAGIREAFRSLPEPA